MRYFEGESADTVWQEAAQALYQKPDHYHCGRNGETREILPCILRVFNPRKRWILSRYPPYNPAFGLVEFIWIVTGNNESRVLNYWNPDLPKYSGSGEKYHGAYGFRLRHEFGMDQIKHAFMVLSNAPETRQAVLQIWKPDIDLPGVDGEPVDKDIPCNMMSLLKVRNGRLYWTQIMRSNDVIRGLPYNIIQFTMLQEVMASWLDCQLGDYFHLSDSLHLYEHDVETFRINPITSNTTSETRFSLSYEESTDLFNALYEDLRLVSEGKLAEKQLHEIFHRESRRNTYRCDLVKDMLTIIGSDAARRYGFTKLSHQLANSCDNGDLRRAAVAWLQGRKRKK